MALFLAALYSILHSIAHTAILATPETAKHKLECVAISDPDSSFNRHLCEKAGLLACPVTRPVLSLDSAILRNAPNREQCLQTLLGLYAAIGCHGNVHRDTHIYFPKASGLAVAYVCPNICKQLWKACSPRATLEFADILADEESKWACKSIALNNSAVQIRESNDGNCLSKIISLSEADVAEINWLLGGKVNWHFIKLKGYAFGIIIIIALLAIGTVFTKLGYLQRQRRELERQLNEKESEQFLELNVNMY